MSAGVCNGEDAATQARPHLYQHPLECWSSLLSEKSQSLVAVGICMSNSRLIWAEGRVL